MKKPLFFPWIVLASLENYYISQHFGSRINNCFQMLRQMFLRRKVNYLHYDAHI